MKLRLYCSSRQRWKLIKVPGNLDQILSIMMSLVVNFNFPPKNEKKSNFAKQWSPRLFLESFWRENLKECWKITYLNWFRNFRKFDITEKHWVVCCFCAEELSQSTTCCKSFLSQENKTFWTYTCINWRLKSNIGKLLSLVSFCFNSNHSSCCKNVLAYLLVKIWDRTVFKILKLHPRCHSNMLASNEWSWNPKGGERQARATKKPSKSEKRRSPRIQKLGVHYQRLKTFRH